MLRLLGKPHVARGGDTLTDLPDKAFVMMALVLLQFGGVASRDQLRTALWEDATADRAAESLRWLLSKVRKWEATYERALLKVDRASVRLAPGLVSDVALLGAIERIDTAEDLDKLLDLYRGELLSDVDAPLGDQLLEIIERHRTSLNRKYVALAGKAAERVGGERGERILRDLLTDAPDDETIVQALLRHLARERGPRAVEAEYRATVERLRAEYDASPAVETTTLFAQLVPASAKAADYVPSPPVVDESGIPRIVLLPPATPFAVDPHAALVADAMVEDVSLQLCRMRTFAMFAPHTARQVVGLDAVAAVAPYGVGYVAATRLLPTAQGGLRLSLSLVRTSTNSIIFADQFEFDEAHLGARFAELAESIAGHLATAVEQVEIGAYRRTGSASAYVQYLLGSKILDNNELKSLRQARHHFERALKLEPNYVPALTGIARTLTKESLALRRSDRELTTRAMALADKATKIDPLDPNAWREKALASLYLHDLDASLAHLDAAQMRAPHHADIIADKAEVLVHVSRPQEAKQHVLQALSLNPLAPDDYHWILASAEYFLGRYEAAGDALRKMKNMDNASRLAAAAAAMANDMESAARYRSTWLEIHPNSRVADVATFMPHARRADLDHFCEGLKRAGFP
jgi:DNA-binding SARP family transcriptional activator/tetratricopeptide (TPR) repeat protein